MLVRIHNLPGNICYNDVKDMLRSCGLKEVILDNLKPEKAGTKKCVTVGLPEEGDVAILVQKIHGIFMDGGQLVVETVRQNMSSEDNYRDPQSYQGQKNQQSEMSVWDKYNSDYMQSSDRQAGNMQSRNMPDGYMQEGYNQAGNMQGGNLQAMMTAMQAACGNMSYLMPYLGNQIVNPPTPPSAPAVSQFQGNVPYYQQQSQINSQDSYSPSAQQNQFNSQGYMTASHQSKINSKPEYMPTQQQVVGNLDFSGNLSQKKHAINHRGDGFNEHNRDSGIQGRDDYGPPRGSIQMQSNRRDGFPGKRSMEESNRYDNNRADRSQSDKRSQDERSMRRGFDGRSRSSNEFERNWNNSRGQEVDLKRTLSSTRDNMYQKNNTNNYPAVPFPAPKKLKGPQGDEDNIAAKNIVLRHNCFLNQATNIIAKEILRTNSVVPQDSTELHNELKKCVNLRISAIYGEENSLSYNEACMRYRQRFPEDNDRPFFTAVADKIGFIKPQTSNKPEGSHRMKKQRNDGKGFQSPWSDDKFRAPLPSTRAPRPQHDAPKSNQSRHNTPYQWRPRQETEPQRNIRPEFLAPKTPGAQHTFARQPQNKRITRQQAKAMEIQINPFQRKANQKMSIAKQQKFNMNQQKSIAKQQKTRQIQQKEDNAAAPTGRKRLPTYPEGNKEAYKNQKVEMRKEFWDGNIPSLPPLFKQAMTTEIQNLLDVFTNACEEVQTESREVNPAWQKSLLDFERILKVRITKRVLDVNNHLMIRIFSFPRVPKRQLLDDFLKAYGVTSLKRSDGRKLFVAHCGTFEAFDKICALGPTQIDDMTVTFKPLHLCGPPKEKRVKQVLLDMVKASFDDDTNQVVMDDAESDNADSNDSDDEYIDGDMEGDLEDSLDGNDAADNIFDNKLNENVTIDFTEDVECVPKKASDGIRVGDKSYVVLDNVGEEDEDDVSKGHAANKHEVKVEVADAIGKLNGSSEKTVETSTDTVVPSVEAAHIIAVEEAVNELGDINEDDLEDF